MNVEWPSGELTVAVAASLWAQRLMAEPDHHAGVVRHRWRLERSRQGRPVCSVIFCARESIDVYLACSRMRDGMIAVPLVGGTQAHALSAADMSLARWHVHTKPCLGYAPLLAGAVVATL